MLESEINEQNMRSCKCQLLRSANEWSIGLSRQNTETSIQIAYLKAITKAKHMIYLENQFFISGVAGGVVHNVVVQALVDRILLAVSSKSKFRVVVVLPLLPGFEGHVESASSAVMKVQLHWEYKTICRGQNSLLQRL